MIKCQITVFRKNGGPLTERITLVDGKPVSHGSDCLMAHGTAHRAEIDGMPALARLINNLDQNQAYALGRIKDGHPDQVDIVPTAKLNGATGPAVIARSKKYLIFNQGEFGIALLDTDFKGMPDTARRRMEELGGPWSALCAVLPVLKTVARVERASTSSGLRNKETGETFPGSGGLHIVLPVRDAVDIPRCLSVLHDHLWLDGLGWGMPSEDGRFLERSLIDKAVGSPERLVFEGPPIVEPPLVQEGRDAIAHGGDVLDTQSAFPLLTTSQKSKLKKLKDAERERLKPELKATREKWSTQHVERLVASGMAEAEARELVNRWIDWQELTGEFELLFDNPDIGVTTVANVLAAPNKYIGESLSDPFAGPGYGRCKAKLYQRPDGSLFIKSYAHGGIYYELKSNKTAGLILPRGFKLNDDGLWFRKDEETSPIKVSAPFTIEARTSDDSYNNCGLLVKWPDLDGKPHEWAMPMRWVHMDGNAIAAELHSAGLRCGTSPAQHELLKRFFGEVIVERRVRCVDQAGWHGNLYVLPNRKVFGINSESIVLQTERAAASDDYAERGTLDDWSDKVAGYAVGNDLLILTISAAFAAPLLEVLGEPSSGIHIHGGSRIGKTTLMSSAVSVRGYVKQMLTWRATSNGLEAVAAEHCDAILPLDELSQANAREAGEIVYMIANGTGKARASRTGGARSRRSWRAFLLSTGEITLQAKLSDAGLRTRAGQDVRMIELPADAGAGWGVWQNLHNFSSGAELTNHLRMAASMYCGTAGPAYLARLAHDRAIDPEQLVETLRKLRQMLLDAAKIPSNADGQVISVASQLALVGAGGELAIAYDVLPWRRGEAQRAASAGLKRWLSARGGTDAGEDLRARDQAIAFITLHGSSRFERVDIDAPSDQRIFNRAGFKRLEKDEWEYVVLPAVFRNELCAGLDHKKAAEALGRYSLLIPGTERPWQNVRRCGTYGPVRGYCISGRILGDNGNE